MVNKLYLSVGTVVDIPSGNAPDSEINEIQV